MNKDLHNSNIFIRIVFWLDQKTDFLGKIERRRAEWILNQFPIASWIFDCKQIIDIGSGIGDITSLLSNRIGKKIIGLDIVDFRRKEIVKDNEFVFIKADGYHLPFSNSSIDCVLILVTLHHLKFPHIVLKEIIRILKNNGKLIVLEDIVNDSKSFQRFFTIFIDNIINFSFFSNPSTNNTEREWLSILEGELKLEKKDSYIIKWGFLKILKLGVFYLQKP